MDTIKVQWANVCRCVRQGWNSCCLHRAYPLSFHYPTQPCSSSCHRQTLELCLGRFAVCLSEGPQRLGKGSPVTAECNPCSRQDGYYLGSATGAAHVALFWQGFFKCLQNLKARTIQQRPTLQYINQIFLG